MLQITTTFKRIFTVCFIACTLTSCSTDDDNADDSPNNSDGSTFSAKINGTDYNPDFKTAFLSSTVSTILVTGSTGSGESLQLFIPPTLSEGTYDFGFDVTTSPIIAFYQEADGDADDGAFASSGTITISTLNTETRRISGTFSFTGMVENTGETIAVTEGQFNLTWEEI